MTDDRTARDLPSVPMMTLYERETPTGPRLTGRLGAMVVTGFPTGVSPEGHRIWTMRVRERSPVSIERERVKGAPRTDGGNRGREGQ